MTENEAIEIIKYRIDTASEIVGKGEDGNSFGDLELAIVALEKQVPKKPIRKPNADMTHEEVTCPTCGSYCSAFKNKYCDCGQKLDWEGGE